MKFLAFLLLLNVTAAFAQEFCLDESHGSIMSLSQDVIDADNKVQMKDLKKWYKKKTTKEEYDNFSYGFRSVADYSQAQCETKTFLGSIQYSYCNSSKPNTTYLSTQDVALKEGEKKSNNKFLAQVFSKEDGKIMRVEKQNLMMTGEVFIVHKKLKNGENVVYVIDPKINAGHNPIQVTHVEQRKMEFFQAQNIGASFGMSTGQMF